MRSERCCAKNAQQALDRRVKSSEGSLKELLAGGSPGEQELTQTKEKLQQLVAKFREVAQTLRDTETHRLPPADAGGSRAGFEGVRGYTIRRCTS